MHAAEQRAEHVFLIDDVFKGHLSVAFLCYVGLRKNMGKITSICRNNDFRRIYQRGKSFVSPLLVVYVQKNRTEAVRIGITTSKKIGNAVRRNRARRVIREAFYALPVSVRPGVDLVFVARGRTPYVKSTQVRQQMEKALFSAGVLERAAKPENGMSL